MGKLQVCNKTSEAVKQPTLLTSELKIDLKIHIDPHAILMT